MAKGKKYTEKSIASSGKKNTISNRNDNSSSDGNSDSNNSPQNSSENSENNNNFNIIVYKIGNGRYSLYNSNDTSLFANNINSNYLIHNIGLNNIIQNNTNLNNIKSKIIPTYKDNHPVNYSLSFKNKNFESKIRAKTEKNYRNSKNMKNLNKEGADSLSYKIYCDIEAGPSVLPKKKYCDFTGLTSRYSELHTGIRYYNSQIYKLSQNIAQPIKDQYLNIRKALIRLK